MDPIWDYLLNGTLSSDPKEASKLRARSARFALFRGTLYKQGFSAPLLKCIGKEDANYVLREVHEGIYDNPSLGRKNPESRVLLAHDAQRRHGTGQKMQNMSRACQDLTPPIRATDPDHKPLTFSIVKIRHTRVPTHWKRSMQVHHCRSGLLHQVGRGRAISNNHRAKGTKLCLAFHNMQVRNPQSIGI